MMLQYGPYPPEEKALDLPVRRLRPMTAVFKAWLNYPNDQVLDEPAAEAFLEENIEGGRVFTRNANGKI